jgi:Acyl-CoA dehydrogenase, middle domain/Acyl-CoA dehydrogenase, N-terminal domain
MQTFAIHEFSPPGDSQKLRKDLRAFLAKAQPKDNPVRRANCWSVGDAEFSKNLGRAGYIGMTWPKIFGGHERHPLERYVVLEELLAAGAPVGAHWIADRQTGPLLLRYGTEKQQHKYLPGMVKGEVYACIGLSEPQAGSDLAAVRSTARHTPEGWRINGQKLWTSGAHRSHVMLGLLRSEEGSERQIGLSQFLIDLDLPGIDIRPIYNMAGEHDFNEVFFDDVLIPHDALIGERGNGWNQVTAELALERSGPERYLSSHALLVALIDSFSAAPSDAVQGLIGSLTAELWTLRNMSMSVAAKLASGEDPAVEAAIVKDLGNRFEQSLPKKVQAVIACEPDRDDILAQLLRSLLILAPSFSLRGGTTEIMRGMIARGLGLR